MSSSASFAIPLVLFVLSTIAGISYGEERPEDSIDAIAGKMDQSQSLFGDLPRDIDGITDTLESSLWKMVRTSKSRLQALNMAFASSVAEIAATESQKSGEHMFEDLNMAFISSMEEIIAIESQKSRDLYNVMAKLMGKLKRILTQAILNIVHGSAPENASNTALGADDIAGFPTGKGASQRRRTGAGLGQGKLARKEIGQGRRSGAGLGQGKLARKEIGQGRRSGAQDRTGNGQGGGPIYGLGATGGRGGEYGSDSGAEAAAAAGRGGYEQGAGGAGAGTAAAGAAGSGRGRHGQSAAAAAAGGADEYGQGAGSAGAGAAAAAAAAGGAGSGGGGGGGYGQNAAAAALAAAAAAAALGAGGYRQGAGA